MFDGRWLTSVDKARQPVGSVRSKVHRTLKRLRRLLGGGGGDEA